MTSENVTAWPLRDALRTAQAVLDGEIDIIEGSMELARYAHEVVPDWRIDPDFVVFGALASGTDHLPVRKVRHLWSAYALVRADEEIEAITNRHRESVRRGVIHTEYWIPAEDLAELNRNIVGQISVIGEFR